MGTKLYSTNLKLNENEKKNFIKKYGIKIPIILNFKDKNKQLLLARKKREERRERLQASYGEQTESTRPQSKFIHDILYK